MSDLAGEWIAWLRDELGPAIVALKPGGHLLSFSSTRTYRRMVSGIGGSSAVDLNNIPTELIERVEVLTGGASAVYGSEAMAGVVNFVLKKNYEGFALRTQAGVTAPAGKRMGHAGALISGGADTADAKLAVMEASGFTVTRNPSEMAKLLKKLL